MEGTRSLQMQLEKKLSAKHIELTRKVVLKTNQRVSHSGRTPKPDDILDQLAIRAIYLNKSTIVWERKTIRDILARSLGMREEMAKAGKRVDFGSTIAELNDLPEWFVSAHWTDLRLLHAVLANITIKGLKGKGSEIIDKVSAPLIPHYPLLLAADIQFLATGISDRIFSPTKRKPPKANWQSISRKDLEKILDRLQPGTEMEGFCNLFAKGNNSPGMIGLLARAIWLTGMRSGELYNCKVVDNKNGKEVFSFLEPGYFLKDNIAPNQDISIDWLEGFDKTLDGIIESHSGKDEGNGLVLHILTSKTRNSSKLINNETRVQRLVGIGRDDLKSILMTSCIRKIMLSGTQKRVLSNYGSRNLGRASQLVFPDRRDRITFHTLRHAFIDEARKSLPPEEVGTLSGHTSIRTMRGYGGKYSRYSRKRKSSRWFPKPEEDALATTKEVWKSKRLRDQKNDLRHEEPWTLPDPDFNELTGFES